MSVELDREALEPALSGAVVRYDLAEYDQMSVDVIGDPEKDAGVWVLSDRAIIEISTAYEEVVCRVHVFTTEALARRAFEAIEVLFDQAGWSLSIR